MESELDDKPEAEWTRDDVISYAWLKEVRVSPSEVAAGPLGWCIDGMTAKSWIDARSAD